MRSLIGRDGYVSAAIPTVPEVKIRNAAQRPCCHSPEGQRCCQRADSDVDSHEVTSQIGALVMRTKSMERCQTAGALPQPL